MKLETSPRPLGEVPLGAIAMLPLLALPAGAWLVETGTIRFATCGFKRAFGLPCLSCGSTRATVHLFHGDFLQALALQPLTLFVYFLLLAWGALSVWAFAKRRSIRLDLSKREDIALKASLLLLPLLNWAYLIWAGV